MTSIVAFIALLATYTDHSPPQRMVAAGEEDAPFVEFDMSTLPAIKGGWRLTLTVQTTDKDLNFVEKMQCAKTPNIARTCEVIVSSLKECKFKAEIVNRTTIRVYGRMYNDKFLPAIQGTVESPDLTREELPKVKNPPKA